MPARKRQTVLIAGLIESADESATRTHNLLVLSMVDGQVCAGEYGQIMEAARETVEWTTESAEEIAAYDRAIEEAGALLHNGLSPRTERLAARRLREGRAGYDDR